MNLLQRLWHVQGPCVGWLLCVVLLGGGVSPAIAADDPCVTGWDPSEFCADGLSRDARAAVEWDDGTGPAVFLGGWFTIAGCERASRIAKWDGAQWYPLGAGMDSAVNALAVYDDGVSEFLYAGGWFQTAGGIDAPHMARWDGLRWEPVLDELGKGLNGSVRSLRVFDDGSGPALYAGGSFTTAGGEPAPGVARWDGSRWSGVRGPLDDGFELAVVDLAFATHGGVSYLYAIGTARNADDRTISRIARWDGNAWATLPGVDEPLTRRYETLAVLPGASGDRLFVGGIFDSIGETSARNVAVWDGTSWTGLQTPSASNGSSVVFSLGVVAGENESLLMIGGEFQSFGGVQARGLVQWDGVDFTPLIGSRGGQLSGGFSGDFGSVGAVLQLSEHFESRVLFSGAFSEADSLSVGCVALWDGENWSGLGGVTDNSPDAQVRVVELYDAGDGAGESVYIGGDFLSVGGVEASRVARWDGERWHPLIGSNGEGLSQRTRRAMVVHDDGQGRHGGNGRSLFVGGDFARAGGIDVNHVARWDGAEWSALTGPDGTGTDANVLALGVFDEGEGPVLFAGGNFLHAGGVDAPCIARWDGQEWSSVGQGGANNSVVAFEVFDDGSGPALYAAGFFGSIGGVAANYIARWDGQEWSAVLGPGGGGLNDPVIALEVFDDGSGPALYAGGDFVEADGQPVNQIAKWDGDAWSGLPTPDVVLESWRRVWSLEAVPDQTLGRSSLYVGGEFLLLVDNPLEGISDLARWDGSRWHSVGEGLGGTIRYLASQTTETGVSVLVAGDIPRTGYDESPSPHLARWSVCVDPLCPADTNADDLVDIFDLIAFLNLWNAQDPAAELTGDGQIDIFDLIEFLELWNAGCP